MNTQPHQKRIMLVAMNGDGPTTGFAVRTIMISKTLESAGFSVTLLRLYPAFKAQGSWRRQFDDTNIRLIELPIPPTARFSLLRRISYAMASPLIRLLTKLHRIDYIQAEAHEAGLAVLQRKPSGVKVIVDIHGAAPEESEQRRSMQPELHWLDDAERVCLTNADAALVVSPKMIDHLAKKHLSTQLPKFFMIPVNVEELFFRPLEKSNARKALGLEEHHLVYVYSGGAQSYQCIEEMAELFNKLRRKNDNARLVIISGQLKEFQRVINEKVAQYSSEVIYRSAQKHEVPELLAAGDMAFLLRKDDILNTVSCPTKFGEYLACGLPVITTPWAGHAPSIVKDHDTGVIVDFDVEQAADLVEQFASRLSTNLSRKCSVIARETMHWEISTVNLLECYRWLEITDDTEQNIKSRASDEAA